MPNKKNHSNYTSLKYKANICLASYPLIPQFYSSEIKTSAFSLVATWKFYITELRFGYINIWEYILEISGICHCQYCPFFLHSLSPEINSNGHLSAFTQTLSMEFPLYSTLRFISTSSLLIFVVFIFMSSSFTIFAFCSVTIIVFSSTLFTDWV